MAVLHTVIFMSIVPEGGRDFHYELFEREARIIAEKSEYVLRLSPNIWQINVLHGISAFAAFITVAKASQVAYRFLSFDEEPQWIPVVTNPRLQPT